MINDPEETVPLWLSVAGETAGSFERQVLLRVGTSSATFLLGAYTFLLTGGPMEPYEEMQRGRRSFARSPIPILLYFPFYPTPPLSMMRERTTTAMRRFPSSAALPGAQGMIWRPPWRQQAR